MVVGRIIILVALLTLTGCAAAIGPDAASPTLGPAGAAANAPPRIGASDAGGSARRGDFGVVGAGSFPRSFLIPGTDTSIRLGG
jgi:hypothetical protein